MERKLNRPYMTSIFPLTQASTNNIKERKKCRKERENSQNEREFERSVFAEKSFHSFVRLCEN